MRTCLITARAFASGGHQAAEPLESRGIAVEMAPRFGPLSEDEIIAALRGKHGVVASSDPYNERVLEAAPDLRVIARTGVGFDSIDLEAATRRGVAVFTTPGRIAETVADFAFALLLDIARRVAESAAVLAEKGWPGELPGTEVFGKTLGIVGIGAVGAAVARRARGFDMRVLAFDPAFPDPEIHGRGAEPVSLHELLAGADFVTLHANLSPDSRHMIGAAELAAMRPTAFLINTARGGLIDTDALVAALHAGRIAGAALDAFDLEPLPAGSTLRRAPRCLLTPHMAFSSRETSLDMATRAAAAVARVLSGERPGPEVRCLNPEVWPAPLRP